MLCFNYTVGFSWSVAVLNGLFPALWSNAVRAAPQPRLPRTTALRLRRWECWRRPEPPFIPRLQSRFADFPWGRSLLARSCVLRRPDAVIGTAPGLPRGPASGGPRGGAGLRKQTYGGSSGVPSAERFRTAAPLRAGRGSACARLGPGARASRRRCDRACRGLGRLPFRAVAEARRLGPSHPRCAAESCSSSAGVCLVATPIKIWTTPCSTCLHRQASTRGAPRPTCFYTRSSDVWGRGCSALHFPSAPIRQVSCNTLLGGFRLLWPPSCCLDRRTSFGLCAPLAPRNAA